jgi:lysosomal alpha-mannosidase
MYDGFDSNQTFYHDQNGLEMVERRIDYNPRFEWPKELNSLAANFYPVTSAIAMRDKAKGRQVTIFNDRTQAATAGLNKGTFELMQHRRMIQDDGKGVMEPLNETDSKNGGGIKVTARYQMQIFDLKAGNSL